MFTPYDAAGSRRVADRDGRPLHIQHYPWGWTETQDADLEPTQVWVIDPDHAETVRDASVRLEDAISPNRMPTGWFWLALAASFMLLLRLPFDSLWLPMLLSTIPAAAAYVTATQRRARRRTAALNKVRSAPYETAADDMALVDDLAQINREHDTAETQRAATIAERLRWHLLDPRTHDDALAELRRLHDAAGRYLAALDLRKYALQAPPEEIPPPTVPSTDGAVDDLDQATQAVEHGTETIQNTGNPLASGHDHRD